MIRPWHMCRILSIFFLAYLAYTHEGMWCVLAVFAAAAIGYIDGVIDMGEKGGWTHP